MRGFEPETLTLFLLQTLQMAAIPRPPLGKVYQRGCPQTTWRLALPLRHRRPPRRRQIWHRPPTRLWYPQLPRRDQRRPRRYSNSSCDRHNNLPLSSLFHQLELPSGLARVTRATPEQQSSFQPPLPSNKSPYQASPHSPEWDPPGRLPFWAAPETGLTTHC
jgi:hypothetical protein